MIRSNKKEFYIVGFIIILLCVWICYRIIFPSVNIPISPAKEIHQAKKEVQDYKAHSQSHVDKSKRESVMIYDQTAKEVAGSPVDRVADDIAHELQLFERELTERAKNSIRVPK